MRLLIAAFLTLSFACSADTITGRVVAVSDGDTIKVLDSEKRQHTIRLSGIDAPEKAQPFGQRSKENLSSLVFGKTVSVEWSKHDKYGRIVGKVLMDGTDTNLEQIKAGMAWFYRRYAKELAASDADAYERAEGLAMSQKQGLWQSDTPVPPWEKKKKIAADKGSK